MEITQDVNQQINKYKGAIEKGKSDRVKAQTNKENFEKRLTEVEGEIKALGVEPENAATEVDRLDVVIAEGLQKVSNLIPAQYVM